MSRTDTDPQLQHLRDVETETQKQAPVNNPAPTKASTTTTTTTSTPPQKLSSSETGKLLSAISKLSKTLIEVSPQKKTETSQSSTQLKINNAASTIKKSDGRLKNENGQWIYGNFIDSTKYLDKDGLWTRNVMYQDYYKELLSRVSREQFFCVENYIFLVHPLQYGKADKHYSKINSYNHTPLEYTIYKIISHNFFSDDLTLLYTKTI